MLYPLSYEGGPGLGQAVQSLTYRHSPSLPTRCQPIVSSEVGEHRTDAQGRRQSRSGHRSNPEALMLGRRIGVAQRARVDQAASQASRVRSSRSGSCWKPADL